MLCQLFVDPLRPVNKLASAEEALASCFSPARYTYCTCAAPAMLAIYAQIYWPRVGWAYSGDGNRLWVRKPPNYELVYFHMATVDWLPFYIYSMFACGLLRYLERRSIQEMLDGSWVFFLSRLAC